MLIKIIIIEYKTFDGIFGPQVIIILPMSFTVNVLYLACTIFGGFSIFGYLAWI